MRNAQTYAARAGRGERSRGGLEEVSRRSRGGHEEVTRRSRGGHEEVTRRSRGGHEKSHVLRGWLRYFRRWRSSFTRIWINLFSLSSPALSASSSPADGANGRLTSKRTSLLRCGIGKHGILKRSMGPSSEAWDLQAQHGQRCGRGAWSGLLEEAAGGFRQKCLPTRRCTAPSCSNASLASRAIRTIAAPCPPRC